MKLKYGIRLADLSPQIVLAAMVVQECYRERGGVATITSANDSAHSEKSLHYKGRALDFRTRDFAGDKHALIALIRASLGNEFDVLLEDEGGLNEHAHVEWDADK
mgnify:FL=1